MKEEVPGHLHPHAGGCRRRSREREPRPRDAPGGMTPWQLAARRIHGKMSSICPWARLLVHAQGPEPVSLAVVVAVLALSGARHAARLQSDLVDARNVVGEAPFSLLVPALSLLRRFQRAEPRRAHVDGFRLRRR